MATLSEDVQDELDKAQHAAQALTQEVQEILLLLKASGDAAMSPLQRAQAFLAIGHAVQAMHQLHIRVSGKDASSMEAVIKEEKRLQVYTKKVNKAVTEDILKHSRPTLSLNVAAANRFIEAAIPDQLSAEQRAALHTATQSIKGKAEEQANAQAQRQAKRKGGVGSPQGVGSIGPGRAKEAAMAFLEGLKAQTHTETTGISMPPASEVAQPDDAA